MRIEVGDERFGVRPRIQDDGHRVYDFVWLNPPPSYGFTIALVASDGSHTRAVTPDELEAAAAQFVEGFFAPDGIGPADFADFVAERRGSP